MSKRGLVMDIEVYEHYFLVMFKAIDTGVIRAFEMYPNEDGDYLEEGSQSLAYSTIKAILRQYLIVDFNGNEYDMPMLFYALSGATCAELKEASNRIIDGRLRPWQFEEVYNIRVPNWVDHIDLKEPVPGVQISLKLYGGRLHSKRLQDLPIEHDADLTDGSPVVVDGVTLHTFQEKRDALRKYCGNDLDTTIDLYKKATDPKDNIIETRELLTAEFGIDVRSKSDAQIAETIIKHLVEKQSGTRLFKPKVEHGTRYRYKPPAFLKFQNPLLQEVFADICAAEFVVNDKGVILAPKAVKNRKVKIGGTTYSLGMGGLHSTEKSAGHIATGQVLLRDRDVVSYYPALILQCGLFPANMGHHFQRIFKGFFDRRVAAKKAGHKSAAQTLKIFLNGTFGKLGSPYSVLYAPNLLMQVTITGQLSLLMMIERMEAAGIPCVSGNTDGVVMACPVHLEKTMHAVATQWEKDTGFETEETKYRALFSRDVNNYVALKNGGGVKTKGVFADPGVMKNPANTIVFEAVGELLDKGTPIAETILRCRDVRKFLRVQRVTGGAKFRGALLGKVARWYRSAESRDPIKYASGKKLDHQVASSENAMPLMELPDEMPADIDHAYYIQEAHDLLREIGAVQ